MGRDTHPCFSQRVPGYQSLSKQPKRRGLCYQQGESMFVFLTPCILAVGVLSKQSCLLTVIPFPLKSAGFDSKLFSCVLNMELCVRHFLSL